MLRRLRFLFLLVMVIGLFAAVATYIVNTDQEKKDQIYYQRSTLAVQTAIARTVFDLTRTAEADIPHYRMVTVEQGRPLIEIADEYHTTLEVLRMANNLLPEVDYGDGSAVIVPEGIQKLEPPRSFTAYTASAGDTMELLAVQFDIELDLLQRDNPVLATRKLLPGDIVFIPEFLR